jgi:hypothetical protein
MYWPSGELEIPAFPSTKRSTSSGLITGLVIRQKTHRLPRHLGD